MLKIAIIGVGTVGSSVVNILQTNKDIINARAGKELKPIIGVVKNLNKKRDVNIDLTTDIDEAINKADIVVELMGGVQEAYEVVTKALKQNKAVVTANKALLAYHRYELQELASNVPFEFEASVAGGIPIITALREGLGANHIIQMQGIINGTCNYILDEMINKNRNFNEVLKEAQELGYAEADPSFDIGGFDAAHKLLILASIAYGIDAKPEDILIEGITNISNDDVSFAKEFGYSIKLLGIAKINQDNQVELRVHPTLIPNSKMIAKVDGVMNAISVVGDKVGETLYYGAGAGGDATASAVIANLIDIARNGKSSPMLGFKKPLEGKMKLAAIDEIQTKYYIRLEVYDKAGILAQIATIFSNNNISIKNMVQKNKHNKALLLLSTHLTKEKNIKMTLDEIYKKRLLLQQPSFIRIEE
jgi:homoserine dehydrogenase